LSYFNRTTCCETAVRQAYEYKFPSSPKNRSFSDR
jgi:hypothetical protein